MLVVNEVIGVSRFVLSHVITSVFSCCKPGLITVQVAKVMIRELRFTKLPMHVRARVCAYACT